MSGMKALKKLYKKVTGKDAKGTSAGKVLSDFADNFPDISGVLPAVTASDNGKILKVSDGTWGKGDEITELPEVTSADDGKVLKVVDGVWVADVETVELPAYTSGDAGKILAVKADGTGLEWIANA